MTPKNGKGKMGIREEGGYRIGEKGYKIGILFFIYPCNAGTPASNIYNQSNSCKRICWIKFLS